MIAPLLNLADTIGTGFTAHSADEVYGGLAVVVVPLLFALAVALVILVRVAIRWRRTPQPRRVEELVVGLAFIPFIIVWAASGIVAWPETRKASATMFAEAVGVTVLWVGIVYLVRRRLARPAAT